MDKQKLDKKLAMYSAAAAITLAGTAAQGAIQYTPTNITVNSSTTPLDLNGDGTDDVNFGANNVAGGFAAATGLNGASLVSNDANEAVNFSVSNNITAGAHWRTENNSVILRAAGVIGQFSSKGYLGVRFDIGGQKKYGWVSIVDMSASSFKINGYAYEDSGDPIHIVPEPSGLALLAMGAAGIQAFRRKKQNS